MSRWSRKLALAGALVTIAGLLWIAEAALAQDPPAVAGPTQASAEGAPTLVSVASDYVKVVGGVVACVATIFGAPLIYQTFRKTRAEIEKINLEAEKLKREIGVAASAEPGSKGISLSLRGDRNVIHVRSDPRFILPALVLVNAFIAYFYYRIVLFAIDFLPVRFPFFISVPINAFLFLMVFLPVFLAARRVKRDLGREDDIHADPEQNAKAPSA